jgi:hypothetical protein
MLHRRLSIDDRRRLLEEFLGLAAALAILIGVTPRSLGSPWGPAPRTPGSAAEPKSRGLVVPLAFA